MAESNRCKDCNKAVRPRQEGIQCDQCNGWTHRKCNTGVSREDYRLAVRNRTDIEFICVICRDTQTHNQQDRPADCSFVVTQLTEQSSSQNQSDVANFNLQTTLVESFTAASNPIAHSTADSRIIHLKYEQDSKAHHFLYMKEYSAAGSDNCKPKGKTLLVLNIPPYCTEECLSDLFSEFGKVMHVYLHSKPEPGLPQQNKSEYFPTIKPLRGFKVAFVIFKKQEAVKNVLNLPSDRELILTNSDRKVLTGVRKWCKEYEQNNIVDVKKLRTEIDDFMSEFDRLQEEEKNKAKEQEGVPDEEGWITVTRHGKNKGAPRTEVHEKRITAKQNKRRKEMELLTFYRFQLRESKMEQLAQLRKKFEDDKRKITLMKESRRFKPY